MADIHLWGALRPAAGGASVIQVEAKTIRELFRKLEENYPGMAPHIIDFLEGNPCARLAIMADPKITSLFKRVAKGRKRFARPGSLGPFVFELRVQTCLIPPVLPLFGYSLARTRTRCEIHSP